MSKDQAARIDRATKWAERAARENWPTERIARYYRRAISAAVRKERERCVQCVDDAAPSNYQARYYITAINAPANKRKGKR